MTLLVSTLFNESCKSEKEKTKCTIILIHGGFHGAWCWYKLKPILEKNGFNVITPDNSGSGKEFQNFSEIIAAAIENAKEPVILVGHSSGGMVLCVLHSKYPKKIKGLVYLSAFMLPGDMSPPQIMKDDSISIMQSSLLIDQENGVVTVNPQKAKQLFFEDCSDADADYAISKLTPEPIKPKGGRSFTTPKSSLAKQPKRFYIETLEDKALGITTQRKMQSIMPCEKVYSIKSSHSSFLSKPDELAQILVDINKKLDVDDERSRAQSNN